MVFVVKAGVSGLALGQFPGLQTTVIAQVTFVIIGVQALTATATL